MLIVSRQVSARVCVDLPPHAMNSPRMAHLVTRASRASRASCLGHKAFRVPSTPHGLQQRQAGTAAPLQLDFTDHQTVFQHKSTGELLRTLAVLKLCSINKFVDNALPLMRMGEKFLGEKIFSKLARPTFYRQFVGGDTEEELRVTSQALGKAGIRLMVCPAMEEDVGEGTGEEGKYDNNTDYITEIGKMMVRSGAVRPCLQFKITAMMPAETVILLTDVLAEGRVSLQHMAEQVAKAIQSGGPVDLPGLTEQEGAILGRGVARLARFGREGVEQELRLLVDGEYTYMNPGISALALGMMIAFNSERPVVWNTYQCYLTAALDTIAADLAVAETAGCCFGAKIVRGAYLEKERKLAKEQGKPDPVNPTYEATGEMYNSVVDFMTAHIARVGDRCNIVCGTHNESGALHAASRLTELGIEPTSNRVVFGQIYGMAEQISVPMAAAGLPVYKSVPYGPLGEVLPYLSRRAAENRVVLAGARREQEMLVKEIRRRLGRGGGKYQRQGV